jgi:hypothetical protein
VIAGGIMICDQLKKADIARLKVEMRALELGVICSRPVIEGTRYDCVLDTGNGLYRAQVKYANGTSSKTAGAVQVNLRKAIGKEKNHPYLDSEIDALLIYIAKIDRICWFGPEVFNRKRSISIRINTARNGQKKRCFSAAEYLW